MERTPINPVSWSAKLGFDQGQLIEGHKRQLVCSGQDAVDAEGSPQHPEDMGAQIDHGLDNLEAILAAAGMTFANVVRLNAYTTDLNELLKNWARIPGRVGEGGWVTSILGVTQLPAPGLLVLLEATAVD